MSVFNRLYIARIAPIAETWREAIRRGQDVLHDGEIVRESFAPNAFRRADPARVPVRLWHENDKPVGTLSSLTTANGWHIASFTLDHSVSRSAIAIDTLRVGAPVSIGFASVRRDALLAEDGFYWYQDALLNEVSILRADQEPAFEGAQITQVLESDPARRTQAAEHPWPAGVVIDHESEVLVRRYAPTEITVR